MSDYDKMRLMELAGLKYEGIPLVEDMQGDMGDEAKAEQRLHWENGIENNIKLMARQTAVELWDNYAINITDDNECEIKVDTGSGMPLSHLLHFANKLAASGLGSDVKIHGSADLFISLTFKLI